jgi:uncharacterized protein
MTMTPVIDADAHVTEPRDVWSSRLPKRYVEAGPTMVRDDDGRDLWTMGGKSLGTVGMNAVAGWPDFPPGQPPTLEQCHPAAYDAGQRLAYMDEARIWAQVLYPNVAGFGSQHFLDAGDEALKLLCVAAYNDFLAEWCSADPTRLLGVMATPFWDIDATVAEIERGAELGLRGILFTGEPQRFGLPTLGSAHWDPLYRVAAEAGLPIHFHIGGGEDDLKQLVNQERQEAHGYAGTQTYAACLLFLKNGIQCADLISCGALNRHPETKFVSVESGAGWVPFMLEAADFSYLGATKKERRRGDEILPSELFARQVYVTYWFEKATPTYLLDALPVDNVLFETDFPHTACLYQNIQETIENGLGNAPEDIRRKFLWQNSANLYGIPDAPADWLAGTEA